MSQAIIESNEPIPSSVASKLLGLRTKITTWLLVDGLSRVLLTALLALGIHFVADWQLNLDVYQRMIMLVLGGAAVAYVAYKRLLVPLTTPVTDDALILAVEGHYGKELGESLISAVQFSRVRDVNAMGVSPQLVRASIAQGTQAAERIRFGSIVDSGWLFANAALLAVCILLAAAGGYAIANTTLGRIWGDRLVGGDDAYPQDTYLEVEYADGQTLTIPRGDDWPLVVTVKDGSEMKPDEVLLDVDSTSGRRTEKMEVVDKQQRFRLDLKNVVEEFKFRARTPVGRGQTPWFTVKLVERPAVEKLTITKTFPKYAGGQVETLPPGTGPYHVLKGSTLEIKGTGNKPLSKATLVLGETPVPLAITGESEFTASLPADKLFDGGYRIDLVDQEKLAQPGVSEPGPLESKRPTRFTVRVKPDDAPDVAAKLRGISGMVVPQALVPFDCFIKDEFAITDVQLSHQWKHEENTGANGEGKTPLAAVKEMLGERTMRFEDALDLAPLKIAPGSGLSFSIEATDNNNISGPGVGKSTVFLLRVVTEEELWADLVRRQVEQRQDFERLHKNLESYLTDCQALQAAVRELPDLSTEQRQDLLKLQKDHKLLATNIGNVANRLLLIVDEIQNNRLEDPKKAPIQQKLLDNVVGPMQQLAGEEVPNIVRQIDESRSQSASAEPRNAALANAIEGEQRAIATMKLILSNMVEAEGYQEAVQLLYDALKTQEAVRALTAKERERLIQAILEGKDPPKEETPDSSESPE